ncbi:hypothetical protein K432DRAFT_296320 [Lepidopterella palustris CBS 459.81]|uniref:FAM86 N-terminal domain-containing protein n=1 Tax=Lepidopterella palustris CBS 459.81 TaxID=1314670 RepID=A0A8E2EBP8_9PEZI|nr:hypothetical protein K432DRAFT_296320 [Lepidopterella palustris CBS 459.81]
MEPTIWKAVNLLRRQYFQLVDLEHLQWPNSEFLKKVDVQAWIYQNLFDEGKLQSPPPIRYQARVLKQLVSRIEGAIVDPEEDEISDDLISRLSMLLSSKLPSESIAAQQRAFVTYTYPTCTTESSASVERAITVFESRAVFSSSGTTGLRTWEAALHLGTFLTSEVGAKLIRGKNVLELGAGTGLLSILCARHLEASRVIATDGDEGVVDAIRTNIFLNGLENDEDRSIESAILRWGWALDATSFSEDYGIESLDVVIGADVTYDKSVIPALVSTLSELFDLNSSLEVVIAAAIRNEKTFETFFNACSGSLRVCLMTD